MLTVGGIDFDAAPEEETVAASAIAVRIVDEARQEESRNGTWGSWGSLHATRGEVEAIADFAEVELGVEADHIGGPDLSAARLERAVRGKRFLHLATHGWLMPENVRSMLDRDPNDERMGLLGTERTVAGFAPLALCGLVMSGANAAETPEELAARLLTAM
ncbi:MAG: hypothetical protein AAF690_22085, partial [Acidobacteriota bacterium]